MTDNIKLPPLPPLHIVPSVEPVDYPEVAQALMDYAREAVRLNVKGVPGGWKLVPVEATDEMVKVGDQKTWVFPSRECWAAMLSAAPAAPQPAQPLTDAEIKRIATYAPEGISDDDVADIVRRVERMHGIGE